jgi:hypothetical protein
MLLPGCVRMGAAIICGNHLLMCTSSSSYNGSSGRKSSLNNLDPSRVYHGFCRPLLRQHLSVSLDCRLSRANSSLARAKAASRKGRIPHQPISKPQASVKLAAKGKDYPKPLLPILSAVSAEVTESKSLYTVRLRELEKEYYQTLHKHSDVLWLTWEERKDVPSSVTNGWIRRPTDSRNPQCFGISRQTVVASHVAQRISDPNFRRKIINLEQNTCNELAPLFKEMVMARAKIAHLAGFRLYFDCKTKNKMLNLDSVRSFLTDFRSQIKLDTKVMIEHVLEQKMSDLNYDFSIPKLNKKLKSGKTIRDFQLYCPEAQIDWGDLACKLPYSLV